MKPQLLLGIMALVLLIVACSPVTDTSEIVCNEPYMRFGGDCCLDQDANNICDVDEEVAPEVPEVPPEETVPVEDEEVVPPVEQGNYLFSVGFAEGHPPAKLPDQELLTFSIIIEVSNLGERTLPKGDGRVEVGGIINPAALGLTSLSQLRAPLPDDLRPGETISVEFPNLKLVGEAKYDTRGNIQANFCHITLEGSEKCVSRDAYYEIIPAEKWVE